MRGSDGGKGEQDVVEAMVGHDEDDESEDGENGNENEDDGGVCAERACDAADDTIRYDGWMGGS